MNTIEVAITSYPDQPGLVAELWCETGMWGEVRYHDKTQSFTLELYPLADGTRPLLDLQALETILAKTKQRLLEIEGVAPHMPACG